MKKTNKTKQNKSNKFTEHNRTKHYIDTSFSVT